MRIPPVLVFGLLILAPAVVDARRPPDTAESVLTGRTAGEPQSCIDRTRIDSTQIFDSGSVLYRMRGGPDYLNTPKPQCSALRRDRQYISEAPSTFLCRGDILRIVDFSSHIPYGSCPLGDFVPYERVKKGQ